MLVLAVVVLASIPFAGGDLRRMASLRLQATWLLPLAAGMQVLVLGAGTSVRALDIAGHLTSYGLAAAFVWRNRTLHGLWPLTLGAALNAGTIAVNGGTLPASRAALELAGRTSRDGANSAVLADPVLPWLGDVFAVPAWVPFANVFSLGDVLVLVGMTWVVQSACRRPRRALVLRDPLLSLTRQELLVEVELARRQLVLARARRAALESEVAAHVVRLGRPVPVAVLT